MGRGWAKLIRRMYEVDPLGCPRYRGVTRVVAFITERRVIRRIREIAQSQHRAPCHVSPGRAPPPPRVPGATLPLK